MGDESLWVVGPGRIGLSLGSLLRNANALTELAYTGLTPKPPDHPLFTGADPQATYSHRWAVPQPYPSGVVIAVPDGEIVAVARKLADLPLPRHVPVLHTSGVHGAEILSSVSARGNPVGSVHPLAAVADPLTGPERLQGAWFAVEGDPPAVKLGEVIAAAAGGRLLQVGEGGKPLYHAAAVFASNYVVVLLEVAERLAVGAGMPEAAAREALVELAIGAVRNVDSGGGPAAALTGPVARGDRDTVAAHLARLSGRDRALYSVLARETLALARGRELGSDLADGLERLLGGRGS